MFYSLKKTIIKIAVVGAMGAVSAITAHLAGLPVDALAGAVIVIMTAGLKGVENWLKNKNKLL